MLSYIRNRIAGSIKNRLYLLTAIVGVIMLMMVLIFIWTSNTLTVITAIARFERTHTISRVEAFLFFDRYFHHNNPADLNTFKEKWAITQSYNRVFGNLLEMRTQKTKKEFADIVEKTYAEADRNISEILVNRIHLLYWYPLLRHMVDLARQAHRLGLQVDVHFHEVFVADDVLIKKTHIEKIEEIEKLYRELENDFSDSSDRLGRNISLFIKFLSIGILILSVGLTAILAWLTIRSITVPIRRFISYSKEVARGNFDAEIPEISGQELLALSESMATLLRLNQRLKQEVDDKTQMAQKLVRANKEIAESELKQSAMISNISDVIGIIGTNGKITYKSPNIEKWFGWSPQDIIGKDAWITVHPDDLNQVQKVFYALVEKDHATQKLECRYRCKDGSYKFIELTATNLSNEPLINGVLLNYHDISERIKIEAEARNLQNQLAQAQKLESIGRLAGGVAHDINNMLSIIIGNAEMALDSVPTSGCLQDNIQEIISASQRSTSVVRQLLAFARKQTIAPKSLNLNNSITDILKMLKRLIGENIDLIWKPGDNVWPVKMDPSQIDQLLANLAVNARDAIPDVGKMTIETANVTFDEVYCKVHDGFKPGDFVALSVSDNGCGMDKETLKNIFEPFYTTKELGKGTGLGLSTVYGIIKQNDGFINAYSEPGHGSTFRVYLPSCQSIMIEETRKTSDLTNPAGEETLLLVEDEPSILNITKAMLEDLGYIILATHSPAEAIRLADLHDGEIQLLITDVVMPEMNGRDLTNQLIPRYPKLKVLFMSGYTANVIAHHGVLDVGVHFIPKPFSKKELAIKVREVLDGN